MRDGTSLDTDLTPIIFMTSLTGQDKIRVCTTTNMKAGVHELRIHIKVSENNSGNVNSFTTGNFLLTIIKYCTITESNWAIESSSYVINLPLH